jgi:hypothetical protein
MLLNHLQRNVFSIGMCHLRGLHSLHSQFFLLALRYGFSNVAQPVGGYMLQEQRLD